MPRFLTAPLYRPWHLQWGTTGAERRSSMPGDDLILGAQYRATRAVTINGRPGYPPPWRRSDRPPRIPRRDVDAVRVARRGGAAAAVTVDAPTQPTPTRRREALALLIATQAHNAVAACLDDLLDEE